MIPATRSISQGSETPKRSADVESHPNVAKGATLGWGTRRLASAAKADGGDGRYGMAKAVPFQNEIKT